jgi:6-pyruvoyl-tetrahydropterin synthase
MRHALVTQSDDTRAVTRFWSAALKRYDLDKQNILTCTALLALLQIAHSFHDKEFGPAQKLHGATYTCDVDFSCESLAPKLNWVIDIGVASAILSKVLAKYNFQNLNEVFPGKNILLSCYMFIFISHAVSTGSSSLSICTRHLITTGALIRALVVSSRYSTAIVCMYL